MTRRPTLVAAAIALSASVLLGLVATPAAAQEVRDGVPDHGRDTAVGALERDLSDEVLLLASVVPSGTQRQDLNGGILQRLQLLGVAGTIPDPVARGVWELTTNLPGVRDVDYGPLRRVGVSGVIEETVELVYEMTDLIITSAKDAAEAAVHRLPGRPKAGEIYTRLLGELDRLGDFDRDGPADLAPPPPPAPPTSGIALDRSIAVAIPDRATTGLTTIGPSAIVLPGGSAAPPPPPPPPPPPRPGRTGGKLTALATDDVDFLRQWIDTLVTAAVPPAPTLPL